MCLHLLKQKTNSLELTHNNYLDALTDETEFKIEFNIIEEYREKALRIELKSKRVLQNIKSKQNNNEGSNSGNNSHLADCENPYKAITPRLPEVELYKFGGELKDWLTFWNQFKNIHENKNLTNCDKFHYLVQSTKIKSEAREFIESFPITNENYSLAIESLVERYGRKELLMDFYVRELLKHVLNNATKKKQDSLSGLYNKLSTQLRALSSLGITTDQCGIILYPLVESALPTHILRSFERQRKNNETATLDSIVSFLKALSHVYISSNFWSNSSNFYSVAIATALEQFLASELKKLPGIKNCLEFQPIGFFVY
ncbi:uncharacterized protein TNCV_4898391 [Trichonephila clavipes]|nr:uncharacterized protein TNCV_4898391 [Trichonephila clavipes]